MKTGIVRWVMAASVAAGVGLAQPNAAGAAATFVDAAAWHAAIAGLKLPQGQTMPAIAPERITMSDRFGTWTQATRDTETVWFQTEGPPRPWSRTISDFGGLPTGFLGVRSEEGRLQVGFGCYSPVYPCLGMQVAELELETPIMGFAGDLRYFIGTGSDRLRDVLITNLEGVAEPLLATCCARDFYEGFYGILFDEPVRTLRFAWQEDFNTDGGALFHFTNMAMIGVPEPALLLTFAAGAFLLVTGSRATSLTGASFAWRRGPMRR